MRARAGCRKGLVDHKPVPWNGPEMAAVLGNFMQSTVNGTPLLQ